MTRETASAEVAFFFTFLHLNCLVATARSSKFKAQARRLCRRSRPGWPQGGKAEVERAIQGWKAAAEETGRLPLVE